MTVSFEGQVAIVTGAGRSLGRAYALELARRGASVVVNDIAKGESGRPRAEEVVAEIQAAGGKACASRHDVATPEGGQAIVDLAMERFGTLDALINNAGFLRGSMFSDMKVADLQAIVGVHLLAAFYVTQPAWRIMEKKGYGRIVMTASSSTLGHDGNSNYSAAKSGLIGLTNTLALEGAPHGVKVNCLFPMAESLIGVDSPLQGPGRDRLVGAMRALGDRRPPSSVAPLAVYLASKDCLVNGHTYSALGGRFARVFMGVAKGWLAEDLSTASVEAIGQHFDEINDLSNFSAPGSLTEEIEEVLQQLTTVKA